MAYVPHKREVYHFMHTRTGMRDKSEFTGPYSRLQQLELLNRWNRMGQGEWVYWLEEEGV